MLEKAYLYLLIVCAILLQGIVGTSLEEDFGESSKALVRNKRVINRSSAGEEFVRSGQHPYVVNIKLNNRLHCSGAILSKHTVITAARCSTFDLYLYKVLSGAVYTHLGKTHNVIDRKIRGRNRGASLFVDGVALLTVDPPFVYSFSTANIQLHTEPVLANMNATVSGWGSHVFRGRVETRNVRRLRSITVPIMNHRDCAQFYQRIFGIRDEHICTYHEQKQCGYTDAGAPLVIGNELVGVFLGEIEAVERDCTVKPDIYVLLQHLEYNQWIRTNIIY